ncbi:MAG TPA: hypothetical protein VKM55_23660 [Candidatus Lokiarchaeia archaeon]|nr:hypothetical protein [Candidatus Lokiarchaeia archaeon]
MSMNNVENKMTQKEFLILLGTLCGLIFFYFIAFLTLFPLSIMFDLVLVITTGAVACLFLVLLLVAALRVPKTKSKLPSVTKSIRSWRVDLGIGILCISAFLGSLFVPGDDYAQSAIMLLVGSIFAFLGAGRFVIITRIKKRISSASLN